MNLDEISGLAASAPVTANSRNRSQAVMAAPVIARDIAQQQNSLSVLNGFNAQLALKALGVDLSRASDPKFRSAGDESPR